jgi:hypothetical protein
VVVSPARDRPLEEHVRAGAAFARAAADRRVALVASADHGHAHDPDGPYGFDAAAREYDARVVAAVRRAGYLGATATNYDLARPRDLYTLGRIRINGSDGVAGFARKLEGLTP